MHVDLFYAVLSIIYDVLKFLITFIMYVQVLEILFQLLINFIYFLLSSHLNHLLVVDNSTQSCLFQTNVLARTNIKIKFVAYSSQRSCIGN